MGQEIYIFFLTQSETISCLCALVQNMSMKMKMDVIDEHLTRDNDIISVGIQGSLKIKKLHNLCKINLTALQKTTKI